jgi:hypothetical protein
MPGAPQAQLERFGENDWETPFGFVEGDLSVLNKIYSGYGDMVSKLFFLHHLMKLFPMLVLTLNKPGFVLTSISLLGAKGQIHNSYMLKMVTQTTYQRIFLS